MVDSMEAALGGPEVHTAQIDLEALRCATQFMWVRYSCGQSILDADIAKLAVRHGEDRRDATRTKTEIEVRQLLLQCPAHVLTLSLVGSFCSPSFAGLTSKTKSIYDPAYARLLKLFEKMEEWHFGRILGQGSSVSFQKLHASALPAFAKAHLENELRVPLWIFGAHLPDPTPEALAQHSSRAQQHPCSTAAPSTTDGAGAPAAEPRKSTAARNSKSAAKTEARSTTADATDTSAQDDRSSAGGSSDLSQSNPAGRKQAMSQSTGKEEDDNNADGQRRLIWELGEVVDAESTVEPQNGKDVYGK